MGQAKARQPITNSAGLPRKLKTEHGFEVPRGNKRHVYAILGASAQGWRVTLYVWDNTKMVWELCKSITLATKPESEAWVNNYVRSLG
jgi:hypothetical protein